MSVALVFGEDATTMWLSLVETLVVSVVGALAMCALLLEDDLELFRLLKAGSSKDAALFLESCLGEDTLSAPMVSGQPAREATLVLRVLLVPSLLSFLMSSESNENKVGPTTKLLPFVVDVEEPSNSSRFKCRRILMAFLFFFGGVGSTCMGMGDMGGRGGTGCEEEMRFVLVFVFFFLLLLDLLFFKGL